ncbi:hypothetical protein ILUMI_10028 [Ignelater luminosus]|uniref:PDE8-like REC N-terminal domain-containing protein n=1 Tax=Ignelater luminosus TaxID=2038154 RepID=A0A8K0D355_IGNLU|nr:hypothetical protein ILUMI_10028 [Ignelater luminosus]
MSKQNEVFRSPYYCNRQIRRVSRQDTRFRQKEVVRRQISSPYTYPDPAEMPMKVIALSFNDFVDTNSYKQQKDEPEAKLVSFQIKSTALNDKYKTSPGIERKVKNDKYATTPFEGGMTKQNKTTTTTTTTTKILQKLEYYVQGSNSNTASFVENVKRESDKASSISSCTSSNKRNNVEIKVRLKRKTTGNIQLNKNVSFITNRINELDDIRSINNFQSQHPSSSIKQNRSRSLSCDVKKINYKKFKRTRSNSPYPSAEIIYPNKLLKSGDVHLPIARNPPSGFKHFKKPTKTDNKRKGRDFPIDKNVPLRITGVQSENPFLRCNKKLSNFGKTKTTNKEKDIKISRKMKCEDLLSTEHIDFVVGDQMKSWQIMALDQKIDNYQETVMLDKKQGIDKKLKNECHQTQENFVKNIGYGDENLHKQQDDVSVKQTPNPNELSGDKKGDCENKTAVQITRKVNKINVKEARTTRDIFIENYISSSAIPERRSKNFRTRKPSMKNLTTNENNFFVSAYWPQETKIKENVSFTNQNVLIRKDATHHIPFNFSSPEGPHKENKPVLKKTFSDQCDTILTTHLRGDKEGHKNKLTQNAEKQVLNASSSTAPICSSATKLSIWDGVSFSFSKSRNDSSSVESRHAEPSAHFAVLGEKPLLQPVENKFHYSFILSTILKSISTPSTNKRGPQEVKYGLLLPPNRSPLKILLVFHQTDPVSDAMSRAADKLGFDVTFCNSYDGALEEFLSKLHDLVIIDTRTTSKSLDYDTLCRKPREKTLGDRR